MIFISSHYPKGILKSIIGETREKHGSSWNVWRVHTYAVKLPILVVMWCLLMYIDCLTQIQNVRLVWGWYYTVRKDSFAAVNTTLSPTVTSSHSLSSDVFMLMRFKDSQNFPAYAQASLFDLVFVVVELMNWTIISIDTFIFPGTMTTSSELSWKFLAISYLPSLSIFPCRDMRRKGRTVWTLCGKSWRVSAPIADRRNQRPDAQLR